MKHKVSIIGAGTWGTALAKVVAEKYEDVVMWAYEPEVAESINRFHKNVMFLTDCELPPHLRGTNDIIEAVADRDVILSVVPTQVLRSVWKKAAPHLRKETIVVSCSKGIEIETLKLPDEILTECLPDHPVDNRVMLSGPSFAKEVSQGLPTAVTIAGTSRSVAKTIQKLMRTDVFLTFTHDDVIGVEVGGALKNVIAIATGASDGLGFGKDARAALITRGLYEMTKIGQVLGGNPYTFMGMAGIGDLVLTATDEMSRNYTVGRRLGQGERIEDIIGGMKMVAEGYKTAVAVWKLIKKHKITAPICTTVYEMCYEGLTPRAGAMELCRLYMADELRSVQQEYSCLLK